MILTIEASLSIGYQSGHRDTFEVEVDNDASEEQIEIAIEENVKEWAYNYIDIGWKRL